MTERGSALVFSDEFLADLHRRYRSRPPSHQADLYLVATSPQRSGLRQWIEQVVARVPTPGQAKLISRLHAEEHLVNTVNELAVAAVLQTSGRDVLYEYDIGGVTPDWFINRNDEMVPLVVEVWNKNHRQGAGGRRRRWLELQRRIERIPVAIALNVVSIGRQGPPSPDLAKSLARELHTWLVEAAPGAGSQREFRGYRFRVADEASPINGRAFMTIPGEGGAFTTADVLAQINAKIKRYEHVISALGAAFVVVVAHEIGTPISEHTLRNLAAGRQSFEVAFDLSMHGEIADITMPMNAADQPIHLSPAVSGIAWAELTIGDDLNDFPQVRLTLFPNPSCAVQMPPIPDVTTSRD